MFIKLNKIHTNSQILLKPKKIETKLCRTHQRTDLVADGVHTLSDVQACLSVCLLRAGAGFTLLIPPAAHLVHHSVYHTHLHI